MLYISGMKRYNKNYSVTEEGKVYSHLSNRFLTPHQRKDKYGNPNYVRYQLRMDDGTLKGKYAHRIVAETFIKNPYNKSDINHINEDKADNRVSNLEWVSHKENCSKQKRSNNRGALAFKYYPRNEKGHIIKPKNKKFNDIVK